MPPTRTATSPTRVDALDLASNSTVASAEIQLYVALLELLTGADLKFRLPSDKIRFEDLESQVRNNAKVVGLRLRPQTLTCVLNYLWVAGINQIVVMNSADENFTVTYYGRRKLERHFIDHAANIPDSEKDKLLARIKLVKQKLPDLDVRLQYRSEILNIRNEVVKYLHRTEQILVAEKQTCVNAELNSMIALHAKEERLAIIQIEYRKSYNQLDDLKFELRTHRNEDLESRYAQVDKETTALRLEHARLATREAEIVRQDACQFSLDYFYQFSKYSIDVVTFRRYKFLGQKHLPGRCHLRCSDTVEKQLGGRAVANFGPAGFDYLADWPWLEEVTTDFQVSRALAIRSGTRQFKDIDESRQQNTENERNHSLREDIKPAEEKRIGGASYSRCAAD
ncbi:hypothetical protein B0H10DRAFT_2238515 [Mycena sp. CBHHK59/15]|nr:hypothetical protein B0H10DRAFT_2238515 [Mycena sp. CBHHK59/15]